LNKRRGRLLEDFRYSFISFPSIIFACYGTIEIIVFIIIIIFVSIIIIPKFQSLTAVTGG